jgi:hypothetical protein
MRRVHTFDVGQNAQLALAKTIFESNQIPCISRNDDMFAAGGGVPFTECYPELWVLDDSDFDRPTACFWIGEHQSPPTQAAGTAPAVARYAKRSSNSAGVAAHRASFEVTALLSHTASLVPHCGHPGATHEANCSRAALADTQ